MASQIIIDGLKKSFSNEYSLFIEKAIFNSPGIIGIFGVNGSGKSTLFNLMTGRLDKDGGHVSYNSEKISLKNYLLKRKIGYLPQILSFPNWATAEDLLGYAFTLYSSDSNKSDINETLAYWDCQLFAKTPLKHCSHGMQKRVGLALSTCHSPDYLILDEPFSGLDLKHMVALESLLANRVKEGKLTIMSTHILPYAAEYCSRAFILKSGHLENLELWMNASKDKRTHLIKKALL